MVCNKNGKVFKWKWNENVYLFYKNPRRLTPRECARLMGFPDSFKIPVSDTRAYKQFGNSVVVPVMEAVSRAMQPMIVGSLGPVDERRVA